jgi:hypothetical protein
MKVYVKSTTYHRCAWCRDNIQFSGNCFHSRENTKSTNPSCRFIPTTLLLRFPALPSRCLNSQSIRAPARTISLDCQDLYLPHLKTTHCLNNLTTGSHIIAGSACFASSENERLHLYCTNSFSEQSLGGFRAVPFGRVLICDSRAEREYIGTGGGIEDS